MKHDTAWMSQTRNQEHFTMSEVAQLIDELMAVQCIMRPTNEQLNPLYS